VPRTLFKAKPVRKKKQKSFTQRVLDKIFARLEKKSPEQQVAAHLNDIRNAFRTELSGLLAAALFAKKTLDTTRQVDAPFPDSYFLGTSPIDEAGRAALEAYALALERFRGELIEHDTPVSLAAARGMTTWIASLHSMTIPGLLPHGQEIWSRLMTGEAGLEDAHKFLLRRAPSDVERSYFAYRPTALTLPKP
jgi:hypothetical protein